MLITLFNSHVYYTDSCSNSPEFNITSSVSPPFLYFFFMLGFVLQILRHPLSAEYKNDSKSYTQDLDQKGL